MSFAYKSRKNVILRKISIEGISEGFKSLGSKLDGIKLCENELKEFPEISI